MHIRVQNCPDDALKKKIKDISQYVLFQMLPRKKLLNNVSLAISFNEKKVNDENAWGLCEWKDNRYNPRRFDITLHPDLSNYYMFETLIHELVHVKQYLIGDIFDYASGDARWKRWVYDYDFLQSAKTTSDFPWEKEAVLLATKYLDRCKKNKIL